MNYTILKLSFVLVTLNGLLITSCGADTKKIKKLHEPMRKHENFYIHNYGYIKDTLCALKIANTILPRVYGNKVLNEKPFKARLINNETWVVEGTLKASIGGVARLEIDRSTGRILKITHGQ